MQCFISVKRSVLWAPVMEREWVNSFPRMPSWSPLYYSKTHPEVLVTWFCAFICSGVGPHVKSGIYGRIVHSRAVYLSWACKPRLRRASSRLYYARCIREHAFEETWICRCRGWMHRFGTWQCCAFCVRGKLSTSMLILGAHPSTRGFPFSSKFLDL